MRLIPCTEDCQPGQYACSQDHKTRLDTYFGTHNQTLKDHLSAAVLTTKGAARAYEYGFACVRVETAKIQLDLRESEKVREAKIMADNRTHYGAAVQTPPRLTLADRIMTASAGSSSVPMLPAPVPEPFSPDVKFEEPQKKKNRRSSRSTSGSASQG